MARTAVAPVAATREQLLAAVAALPMAPAAGDSADYVTLPVERIEVGAIVCAHAQAKVRGVVVTKVGPKRATIEWTTPSTMAQGEELVRMIAASIDEAGGPDAYIRKAVDDAHRRIASDGGQMSPTAWRERQVPEARQRAENNVSCVARAAIRGYAETRTYTKTVPLAEVYAPVASALTAG